MFLANKIRVEILLPLFDNDGIETEKSKFVDTRKELVSEFKGCTFMVSSQGMWIDKDIEYSDIYLSSDRSQLYLHFDHKPSTRNTNLRCVCSLAVYAIL